METLAGIFALSIALLVMGFFIVMIRKARQAHATRHLEAENLGFYIQEPPDPGLAARITSLHRRTSSQKLALKRVFAKPQGDTTIYLLDLVDTSGEDDSLLLDGAITIVSPLLSLPRFGLFPRVPGEGFLAQSANRLFERLFGHNAQLVDFEDRPAFDKRYLATSDDPEQVRELLSDFIQDRLSSLGMLQIQAGGDTLTVANVGYLQKKPDEPRNLELLYRQALTIFDLLRRSQE